MIHFVGHVDHSGYGVAGRNTCYTMAAAGLDVIMTAMSEAAFRDRVQSTELQTIAPLIRARGDARPRTTLVELTPPHWARWFARDTYNIGYFFWETDRLAASWVRLIEESAAHEVWVPCERNRRACLRGGVRKPIYVVPQASTVAPAPAEASITIGGAEDAFRFYAVGTWDVRKNHEALVRAYFEEFGPRDNVLLVVKAYSHSDAVGDRSVGAAIRRLKTAARGTAPICLFSSILTAGQVQQLHRDCHVYVSTSRGEGWGLSLVDALAAARRVVVTRAGGVADLLDGARAGVEIIPTQTAPVVMPAIEWFDPSQRWQDSTVIDVRRALRKAYETRDERAPRHADILASIAPQAVGRVIADRLEAVGGV